MSKKKHSQFETRDIRFVFRGWILTGPDESTDRVLYIVDPSIKTIGEPFAERVQDLVSYSGKQVSINYHIADEPLNEDEMTEALLAKLMGSAIDGKAYVKYEHRYSEMTGYLWTDEKLMIGGHDLIAELYSHVGKYLHLNFTIHDYEGYRHEYGDY